MNRGVYLSFLCALACFSSCCSSSKPLDNAADSIDTKNQVESVDSVTSNNAAQSQSSTDNINSENDIDNDTRREVKDIVKEAQPEVKDTCTNQVIDPKGMTIESRFPTPCGFERIAKEDGYAQYLRSLPLMPDGSPVLLFNGAEKAYQAGHVAVIDIDVGKRDLQQCADAAMRLRTEYYYKTNQHDKMVYHLTNGQELSWPKWKTGYRLKYLGNNKTEYNKTGKADGSYDSYRKWLDALMMYAGVSSIVKESKKVDYDAFVPGDVVASVGHLIIILDVVENNEDKMFLLGQSYMPAQQIEVLKNPYSETGSPWYSVSTMKAAYASGEPFVTPEWEFPAPGPNLYRMP